MEQKRDGNPGRALLIVGDNNLAGVEGIGFGEAASDGYTDAEDSGQQTEDRSKPETRKGGVSAE